VNVIANEVAESENFPWQNIRSAKGKREKVMQSNVIFAAITTLWQLGSMGTPSQI
jgi:hypothetical protein